MPNEVVGFKINGNTYEYDHEHLANRPTIDATPTAGSTNAVQSGGVKSALDGIQAEIPTVDAVPTQGSNNAVSSGGVKSALDAVTAQIPAIDPTLSERGQAADAEAVGDAFLKTLSLTHSDATAIPANSDLDDYTTAGNYRIASSEVAQTLSNCPVETGARLTVYTLVGSAAVCQICNNAANIFYRAINSGTWSAWKKFAKSEDLQSELNTPLALSYSGATSISSGADLNDYTTVGTFTADSNSIAQSLSNCPSTYSGKLTVMTAIGSTSPMQIYQSIGDGKIYYRAYTSGNWFPWAVLARDSDISALGTPFATQHSAATSIPSNSDFNDYTTAGNYKVTTSTIAKTLSNRPANTSGRLIVFTLAGSTSTFQVYITSTNIFYRAISNSVWTVWKKFENNETVIIDAGTPFATDQSYATSIESGSDLDDFTTAGNYKATSSSIAQTLSNCPTSISFRMIVMSYVSTAGLLQIVLPSSGRIFWRYKDSTRWYAWKEAAEKSSVENLDYDAEYKNTVNKGLADLLHFFAETSTYNIRFANSPGPIFFKNYLGNIQNVHPKVLYFEDGFADHSYWMAYTPYPNSNDTVENPCVAYSDDGYTWTNITGNPLAITGNTVTINGTEYTVAYNSDTHLVYRDDTETLECWYRAVVTDGINAEVIYRRTTQDGETWTAAEVLWIDSGHNVTELLSPAVEWDGTNYNIWVVGNHSGSRAIDFYTASGSDPTAWTFVRSISLSFTDGSLSVAPWHIDAIIDNDTYILLVMCRNGTQIENNACSLFITTSSDNINYITPYKVVEGSGAWDQYMYRSSIVNVGSGYRIYYSAGAGGTTSIYNHAKWGIGITESQALTGFIGKYV